MGGMRLAPASKALEGAVLGWEFAAIVVAGAAIGVLGALLGIGGGVLMVPLLSVGLGVPIQSAIAASLVGVIATSCAATGVYLGSRLTNPRLGVTLGIATTAGGILGGLTGVSIGRELLTIVFAASLLATAVATWVRRDEGERLAAADREEGQLGGHFYDPEFGREVRYAVRRLPQGLGLSMLAGVASGLLGIGGGVINVPSMVLMMDVPVKAAVATSNLMLGFTAVASAFIYYSFGYLDVAVATAVAVGLFLGSLAGAWRVPRLRGVTIRRALALLLAFVSLLMFLRAAGLY